MQAGIWEEAEFESPGVKNVYYVDVGETYCMVLDPDRYHPKPYRNGIVYQEPPQKWTEKVIFKYNDMYLE